MGAVEKQKERELLNQSWRGLFDERYHHPPKVLKADAETLEWLIESFGLLKAEGLLSTYLQMKDPYFLKTCHSLTTLKADINKVIAHYGQAQKVVMQQMNLKIRVRLYCGECKQEFEWHGMPSEMEKTQVCDPCQGSVW